MEVIQKTFRFHKVSTLEAFTESAIDRGEDCPRVVSPAFLAQQPRKACGAAQLPGESLLVPRQVQGLLEQRLRF